MLLYYSIMVLMLGPASTSIGRQYIDELLGAATYVAKGHRVPTLKQKWVWY